MPDFEDLERRLSGELSKSKNIKIPIHFIGPLSAIQHFKSLNEHPVIDVLVLLSGVEPQRSILEEKIIHAIRKSNQKIVLVRGSEKENLNLPGNIQVINSCFGETLYALISGAKQVICRSGYSTLMDLYFFDKKRITLIPTPGQGEQIYLARYWSTKFSAKVCDQNEVEHLKF